MPGAANHLYFDRFSVVHAAVGALAALSRIPAPVVIGGSIAFEAVEDGMKERVRHIWPDPRPDGIENKIGDVASVAAGYYATRAFAGSPAGAIAVVLLAAAGAAIWTGSLLPAAPAPARLR